MSPILANRSAVVPLESQTPRRSTAPPCAVSILANRALGLLAASDPFPSLLTLNKAQYLPPTRSPPPVVSLLAARPMPYSRSGRLRAIQLPCCCAVPHRTAAAFCSVGGVLVYLSWALSLWRMNSGELPRFRVVATPRRKRRERAAQRRRGLIHLFSQASMFSRRPRIPR